MENMKMNNNTEDRATTHINPKALAQLERDRVHEPDVVNEPPHYKNGKFEVIDEMLIVFGPQKTFDFCIMNAWKYRARAPFKGKMEQDMDKANRYMEMAKQIADAYKDEGYALSMPPVHLIKGE